MGNDEGLGFPIKTQEAGEVPATFSFRFTEDALYDVQSGLVVGPDGMVYSVENSRNTGDSGWKDMLAPAVGQHG